MVTDGYWWLFGISTIKYHKPLNSATYKPTECDLGGPILMVFWMVLFVFLDGHMMVTWPSSMAHSTDDCTKAAGSDDPQQQILMEISDEIAW